MKVHNRLEYSEENSYNKYH